MILDYTDADGDHITIEWRGEEGSIPARVFIDVSSPNRQTSWAMVPVDVLREAVGRLP